ncbi:MAG: hypothetical protein ABI768_01505 [Acidobacteriota bacterium]
MNTTMRNLTLTAAALAALTVIAPKATAEPWKGFPLPPSPHQVREMFQERHGSPRNQAPARAYGNYGRGSYGGQYGRGAYGNGYRGPASGYSRGNYGGYGRRYVAPVRPYARHGYGGGYGAPYRTYSGLRFYSSRPGPGYVYIADNGWALPPFPGAVWYPGDYDDEGLWIEGCWR